MASVAHPAEAPASASDAQATASGGVGSSAAPPVSGTDGRVAFALPETLIRLGVRTALAAGSLLGGSLFWLRAVLGRNQLTMHDCTADGEISIGGVNEQLYSEGFVAAWHDVLGRKLGPQMPDALYEVGRAGARWEITEAIRHGTWVPALLRSLIGRKELLEKVRTSDFYHTVMQETLRILYRMIMTEGGWGVVEEVDLRSDPIRLFVANTPETRRVGYTGECSCHLARGIYTGQLATIFDTPAAGRETSCRSRGDPICTFAITLDPR